MFTNLNCRSLRPVSVFSPPARIIIRIGWREAGGNYLWTFNIIFGNKNIKMFVQLLTLFFGHKNIKMSVHGLILSPTSSGWIDCLSSDNHSSHHSTILFYINIFWLKHKSFDFIASISYSYSIIVLFPHPHWPPEPHLGSCHFLVLARLFYPPLCLLFVE